MRTPNLVIWSQMRRRCATPPMRLRFSFETPSGQATTAGKLVSFLQLQVSFCKSGSAEAREHM